MSELKKRTIHGLKWSFIDNISGTGVNFLVGIVLARYLTPDVFGIIGVALILVTISNVVIDGGFSNALIRTPSVSEDDYNTSFIINILTALFLYKIFFFGAPFIANFFNEEELKTVIRLIGIIVPIGSLSIVPKTRLTRDFDFKRQAIASLFASLTSAIVGIYMAYNGSGIYALVAQQLVRQSIYTLSLWCIIRTYPKLHFSPTAAKSLFHYGSRILMSGLIDAIYNNLYNFVIGKTYSPYHLGLYNRAEQFSSIFAINFSIVIQRVSLPLFTKNQKDEQAFSKSYQTLLRFTTLFTAITLLSFCAVADHLIPILIGSHWTEAIPIIRILCLSAIFQPMIMINQNILQVKGKSQLFLNIEIGKKFFSILVVGITLSCGMTYLLWGIVLVAVVSYLINSYFGSKYFPTYTLTQQFKDTLIYILPSSLMAFIAYWIVLYLNLNLYLRFLIQMLLIICGVFIILRFIFVTEYRTLRTILQRKK